MYRYIGNKTAILDSLLEIITSKIPPNSTFLDPMCGTASVSAALASNGYRVAAGDILTFPRLHAEVRLRMAEPPRFQGLRLPYKSVLGHLGDLEPVQGYFWNEYSDDGNPTNAQKPRRYFTPGNASKIDAIDLQIKEWRQADLITGTEWKLLRHDLIMSANKIANIAGTYGHYRSSHSKASIVPLTLTPTLFNHWAGIENIIVDGPAEIVARSMQVDVLYLDPPYTKRQYGANYHLLETLAIGDNPIPNGESGLRDWWPQHSSFCSKRKVQEAFRTVLGGMNYRKAFVSYSEDGLVDKEVLESWLRKFGEVTVHNIVHKRFRSNLSQKSKYVQEYVFEVDPS